MSKRLIEGFFPSITAIAKTLMPRTYNNIFPGDVVLLCPEPTIALSPTIDGKVLLIRNPALLVSAILGVVIGVFGGNHFTKAEQPNKAGNIWAHSFFNFAMMNVTAIFLHCLLPPLDNSFLYAEQHATFWLLDCYFTGVSSILLIGGALGSYESEHIPKYTPRTWILLSYGLGLAMAGFFQLASIGSSMKTLPLELWYLLPLVLAAFLLIPLMCFGKRKLPRLTIVLPVGSVLCLIGGLSDAKLCRWTNGLLLDSFMGTSLVFIACDIGFVWLRIWLGGFDGEKKTK